MAKKPKKYNCGNCCEALARFKLDPDHNPTISPEEVHNYELNLYALLRTVEDGLKRNNSRVVDFSNQLERIDLVAQIAYEAVNKCKEYQEILRDLKNKLASVNI